LNTAFITSIGGLKTPDNVEAAELYVRRPAPSKDTHHLLGGHAHRLDREFAPTHVEEVFQIWTQKIDHENIVETLLAKVMYLRNTGYV
jgi:hypothetical protein